MDLGRIEEWVAHLLPRLQNLAVEMLQPWRLYQVAILLGCLAAAWGIERLLRRRLAARLARFAAGDRGLRAMAAAVLGHVRMLLFLGLAWAVFALLRATTWPGRSYIIGLVASLVTAWAVASLAGALVRNRLMRAILRWGAFTVAGLGIMGQLDATIALLDSAAIQLGDVRLSILVALKALISLALLLTGATWLSDLADRQLGTAEDLSPSMRVLAQKLIRLILYASAVIFGLQSVGFDLTTLTVLSGAIGLGLGFGLQKIVSNLVSGIILLMDKSIKPGDVISLGDTFGWITGLGARYVSIMTRDGRTYLIPNEDLITGQVVNWSHGSDLVRLDVHFGVSYASDPHQVRRLAREAAAGVRRVLPDPAPVCHITGFGESSIDFVLRFWIRDPSAGLTNVRGDVYLALWDALKAAGVEIPFPRRDITILNAGDLRTHPPAPAD
ncbi:MAG: mechanosensitive ion channel family protein [Alphaproteobacteria bacterium]|nr:MAG: mechanosensitive ion channel family protein [Alphaproteobacteria bacterium]